MGSQPPKKKQRTVISFDAVRISGPFSQTEDGELQIEGVFEGAIACHALIIPEGGTAKGDVKADWVVVQGNFSGNIETNFFTATKDAIVLGGNITVYEKVLIEPGCLFRGDLTRPVEDGSADGARLSWTDEVAARGAAPLAISQRSLPEADQALIESVHKGETETVERLLLAGASPSAVDDAGMPILIAAVHAARAEIARLLLEAGADPGLIGNDGLSALATATEMGATGVVEALLGYGADPNLAQGDGSTPLILAARRGRTEIARALLAAGADLHVQNEAGEIPMLLAKQRGYNDTFDLLKRAAAGQETAIRQDEGPEPAQAETAAKPPPPPKPAAPAPAPAPAPKAVPQRGPAAADDKFDLFPALRKGDSALLDDLIQRGADPNQVGANGISALMHAVERADGEAVDCLLARGADPNAVADGGETALLIAVISGSLALTRRLLAQGADPNAARPDGSTPLIEAARNGRTEVARQLLSAGAQLDVSNDAGESPMRLAEDHGFKDTVVLFRQAAPNPGLNEAGEAAREEAAAPAAIAELAPDAVQDEEEPAAADALEPAAEDPMPDDPIHDEPLAEEQEKAFDAGALGADEPGSASDDRQGEDEGDEARAQMPDDDREPVDDRASDDDREPDEDQAPADEPETGPAIKTQPDAPVGAEPEAEPETEPDPEAGAEEPEVTAAASPEDPQPHEEAPGPADPPAPAVDQEASPSAASNDEAEGPERSEAPNGQEPFSEEAPETAATAEPPSEPPCEPHAAPVEAVEAEEDGAAAPASGAGAMPALKGFMGMMAPDVAPSNGDPATPFEADPSDSQAAAEKPDPEAHLLEPEEVEAMRLRLARALAPFTLESVGGAAANGDGEAEGNAAEMKEAPEWRIEEINEMSVAHASLPRAGSPEAMIVTVVKTAAEPDSEPLRVDVYLSEAGEDATPKAIPDESSVTLFQADRALIFWPIGFQRVAFNDGDGRDLYFCDDDGNWSRRSEAADRGED